MSSYHTVAVVANGAIHDYTQIAKLIKAHVSTIAVDGGLVHCDAMHIMPDMLVGDLDSIPKDLLERYPDLPIRRFATEKDETDLELALQGLYTPEIGKISVYGALEMRTDHTLANLHLIRRYPERVFLESETELLFAIAGSTEIACKPGQLISFIPIGDPAAGINSEGLKWELRDYTFSKYFFSLSNVCLSDKVKISIENGDVICCLQKR